MTGTLQTSFCVLIFKKCRYKLYCVDRIGDVTKCYYIRGRNVANEIHLTRFRLSTPTFYVCISIMYIRVYLSCIYLVRRPSPFLYPYCALTGSDGRHSRPSAPLIFSVRVPQNTLSTSLAIVGPPGVPFYLGVYCHNAQ